METTTPTSTYSFEPWWMNVQNWTTRDGDVIPLEQMTADHRSKVIAFLSRPAAVRRLRTALSICAVLAPHAYCGVDAPYGDTMDDPAFDYLDWLDDAPDSEIIESVPLVRRLRELNAAEA